MSTTKNTNDHNDIHGANVALSDGLETMMHAGKVSERGTVRDVVVHLGSNTSVQWGEVVNVAAEALGVDVEHVLVNRLWRGHKDPSGDYTVVATTYAHRAN